MTTSLFNRRAVKVDVDSGSAKQESHATFHDGRMHGGDLQRASERYGVEPQEWLDLSTGINPVAYPVGNIAAEAFQQLPYQSAAFKHAVGTYYLEEYIGENLEEGRSISWVATNGSQQMIQALPACLLGSPSFPVLIPNIGYQEHRQHWALHGTVIEDYPALNHEAANAYIEQRIAESNQQNQPFHCVIINPNNPTGLLFSPAQLVDWARRMPAGGMMIIDEAFIDAIPEQSVLPAHFEANMIVLRSFGKFFGLAGLRLGFTFASEQTIKKLSAHISPWDVNGPAQAVAIRALSDENWQQTAIATIQKNAQWTQEMLSPLLSSMHGKLKVSWQTKMPLFLSVQLPKVIAMRLVESFAQQGVLLRLIDVDSAHSLIRIGIVDRDNPRSTERFIRAIKQVF